MSSTVISSLPFGRGDNRADQRDSQIRHVLGGGGQVQFKLRHRVVLLALAAVDLTRAAIPV